LLPASGDRAKKDRVTALARNMLDQSKLKNVNGSDQRTAGKKIVCIEDDRGDRGVDLRGIGETR
jgi:hypothetical protein